MAKRLAALNLRLSGVTMICFVAACSVPAAQATTGVVDQSNLPSWGGGFIVGYDEDTGETFTPAVTGTMTDVAFEIRDFAPSDPLVVEVTEVTNGQPDLSEVIGSGSVPETEVTGSQVLVTVPLTVVPTLTAGVSYALVLSYPGSGAYVWDLATNSYANGDGFDYYAGVWSDLFDDFSFASYMVPTPPPSPPALSLSAPRGAYCTVAGNTSDSDGLLMPGTFVNLDDGQAWTDWHYEGASPASFIQGEGLTCDPPPTGSVRAGFATESMNVDPNTYPYYTAAP